MTLQSQLIDLLKWKLTQAEIAQKVGCSQSTISDLANGKPRAIRATLHLAIQDLHKQYAAREKRANRKVAACAT